MSESESQSAVVLELAEEFLRRYREGERPSLKEYIDRRPDLAAEIREVFPAMALPDALDYLRDAAPLSPQTRRLALALAEHRLGEKEQARITLTRLCEVMKGERWAGDVEALAFLAEAEQLIEGQPVPR